MTRKELLRKVEEVANSKGAGVNGKQVEKVFCAAMECIKAQTVAEEKLTISDLGIFYVKTRAARQGRNPHTGETLQIPEKKAVAFKPAKAFKESVH